MMKIAHDNDIESSAVPDTTAKAEDSSNDAVNNESSKRCYQKKWCWIVFAIVTLAALVVVGVLFGLDVIGSENGGYKVETEWSVINNCMYSYCWKRDMYYSTGSLDVGDSVSKHFLDGSLTTKLKSVNGDMATFEVSSNVRCLRKSTATARIGGGYGEWSGTGTCGRWDGTTLSTKARVKIS